MLWDATILEQFELINHYATDESEYYGPYITTLLTDMFPNIEHYQVAPCAYISTTACIITQPSHHCAMVSK